MKFKKVRGYTDVKTATVNLLGKELKLCVVFGTASARTVLDKLKTKKIDYLEVMACPNGCVGGGGQPKQMNNDGAVQKRAENLYLADEKMDIRSSFENSNVKKIYDEFLGEPLSEKSKTYLHTSYKSR